MVITDPHIKYDFSYKVYLDGNEMMKNPDGDTYMNIYVKNYKDQ